MISLSFLAFFSCSTNSDRIPGNTNSLNFRNSKGELVETYSTESRVRSGVALGGIGTGSIELRKDGRFYNWTIFNNWPKETGTPFLIPVDQDESPMSSLLFFKVRYQVEGEEPQIKILQINDGLGEGNISGLVYYFPWMSAVQNIEYKARFPFVNIKFSDPDMPFVVHMEAWSPFIPHDVKSSSLPVSYFDFTIEAKTDKKVDVMLIASQRNTVSYDNDDRYYTTDFIEGDDYLICNMSTGGVDKSEGSYGQLNLTSLSGESTYYGGWSERHPYYEHVLRNPQLPNLDDTDGVESILRTYDEVPEWMPHTNGRNMIEKTTGRKMAYRSDSYNKKVSACYNSLAISNTLGPDSKSFTHSFAMSWNFPNKYASVKWRQTTDINEGNYHNNFFGSGAEIAQYAVREREDLYDRSRSFLDNFFDSSLDVFALEQINSQLNTFVTSGRLVRDGYFGVLEGLASNHSWGPIATIDVSLYGSQPAIALFPELQKSMMRAHKNVQTANGMVHHGLFKNFHMGEDETWNISNRIDLPGQYIMLIARDYFWTQDKEYLEEMYPSLLKALEYVLNDLDLNNNMMPNMEGHRSSYDNFPMYGLASYIQSQWLCAMASLSALAEEMGDLETQEKAEKIFAQGSELMDEHLWNGKYYRLYNDYDGAMGKGDLNEGCLTDQIIGQWAAHHVDLGYLFNENHIRTALNSILEMSFKEGKGLRNSSWPGTEYFTDIDKNMWVDQGNTFWTGVELAFASFLIYEGMVEEGMEIIKAVDDRYRKSGLYWDHQEFGGHYYRPMSAWAILNAMLGFSLNNGTYAFAPKYTQHEFRQFFSTPNGTAHYISEPGIIKLKCNSGALRLNSIKLTDKNLNGENLEITIGDDEIEGKVNNENDQIILNFDNEIILPANTILSIKAS